LLFRGSVRVGLRAVGAVLTFYGGVAVGTLPILLAVPNSWLVGWRGIAVQSAALMTGALIAYAILLAKGWATLREVGWPGQKQAAVGMARGGAIGLLMAAVALAAAMTGGSARLSITGESLAAYGASAVPLLGLLLVAALAEELLFRGYPLARLSITFGKVPASLGLAALFALAHLGNPATSAIGLVNIGLASLVLSAAFFTPGGLPAAWGLHLGWNAGLGLGADAPVSGVQLGLPTLEFASGEPSWLTGGNFGPEGGIVSSLVMAGALMWLIRNNSRLIQERVR
jgi:membrane protease YdiL (CAAX protease family)